MIKKHYSKVGNRYVEVNANYKHICNDKCLNLKKKG